MKKSEYKVHIVGAGISGLIAAQVLEKSGYHPVIIESEDSCGGRVKTDQIEGYAIDHGFQVLLTSYPAAKQYLDFNGLALQEFLPGAAIFEDGKQKIIGDPLRDLSLLWPTITANIGSFSDKRKILKLNQILKKTTIHDIFEEREQTTVSFLEDFGFSSKIIHQFFKPFFTGIFLEENLQTSSRMFKFVYKMFGDGNAAIPKLGIGEITKQLVSALDHTSFIYNTKVEKVAEGLIVTTEGKEMESHFTIIATEPSFIIPNLKNQQITWKSCDTLYFETKDRAIHKPLIGLIPHKETLINNICYPTVLQPNTTSGKELLSVTVVRSHNLSETDLIAKVTAELAEHCSIQVDRFIKRYDISHALPDITNLQYEMLPSETRLTPTIFIAGDQQLNGSLNAAMISGERAAMGVIDALENGIVIEELTSDSI
ncbi:FAD-dependent oxidoreductase [uncultured Aquimarina sp.]|uniref:FAD-dependent oxidoreductase n=1 Tax=uncultured Aquimarina sp. TaxID=575652 RepID=UPI00261F878C|nr:FAD-dependent oxidoreductase [uncultured Aquimarina sp.]